MSLTSPMLEHLGKPKSLLAVAQQDGGRQSNVCTVFLDPVPGLASTPSTLVLVSLVHLQHHFFAAFQNWDILTSETINLEKEGEPIQDFPSLRLNGIHI